MKSLKYIALLATGLLIITSCYKSTNWLDEVADPGKFIPNIFFNNLDSATFSKGSSVRCNLEYWSKDAIKEIQIYDSIGTAARKLVATIPYAPAYSTIKKSDTLIYQYTVPASAASNATIRLDAVAVGANGLNRTSNRPSFRVK